MRQDGAGGGNISRPTLFLLGVDDSVRQALQDLMSPAGCAVEKHDSARSFLETFDPQRPGCVILDVAAAGSDVFELHQKLSSSHPVLPVIVLAGEGPLPPISRGFTLGPVDFLRGPVGLSELRRAVMTAMARDQEARCRNSLIAELRARAAQLTGQERQVMGLMVQGLAQKDIASTLNIGKRTVQLRRSRVMCKMQAASLVELVQFALILDKPSPSVGEPADSHATEPHLSPS
jgi:two-component system response regulator FixJ